jgi:hypothetical protein
MTISPTSIFEMRLWCALAGHAPDAGLATWNIGYCFSRCERCGRDIVRTGEGRWKVPHGYRIVWRPLPAKTAEPPAQTVEHELPPAIDPEPLPWGEVADPVHFDVAPEDEPPTEPEPLPAEEVAAEEEPIHFDAAPEIAPPEDEPPAPAIEPDPPATIEAEAPLPPAAVQEEPPLPQAAIEIEAPLPLPERARDFMDMEPEEEDWDDLAALPAPQIAAAAAPAIAAPRWLASPD